MPTQDLTGSTAIVTGASRGLGRGVAGALSLAGAQVIGVARDRTQLDEVRAELGESFTPVVADAADPVVAGQLIDAYQPRTIVLNIQVTLDAHDPRALSSFWREVLGYVHPGPPGVDLPEDADPLAAWDEFLARVGVPQEQRNTRSAIEDPDGHGPRLFFQQVPEDKVAKNRVHLDVRAAPGLQGQERMAALEAECDRLVALGAKRVRRFEPAPPLSAGFIVMTDPEGNEFCLD